MMLEKDKKIIKDTLLAARFGLLIFFGFWTLAFLGVPIKYLLVLGAGLITVGVIKNKGSFRDWVAEIFWFLMFVGIVLSLNHFLGGWGLLGSIIILLTIVGFILYKRRKVFMDWIYYIEERYLYGKRLGGKKK